MIVELWKRDFSSRLLLPPVKLEPVRYRWSAIGGPESAEIAVSGGPNDVMQVANWLRCGVVIYDDTLTPLWWGYVNEVSIPNGKGSFGWTLDNMANKTRVIYEKRDAASSTAGDKTVTGWLSDTASQTLYGIKCAIFTSNAASQAKAFAQRATQLARLKDPLPTIGKGPSDGARLYCKGWWSILGWSQWQANRLNETSVPSGGHMPDGTFGFTNLTPGQRHAVAQSFQLQTTAAWSDFWPEIVDVQLIKKTAPEGWQVGVPDLTFSIQTAGGGGLPSGVILTSGTIKGADVQHWGWHKINLSPAVGLTAGVTYFIVYERTSDVKDLDKNCEAPYIQGHYARGRVYGKNVGAGWAAIGDAADDLLFGLWGSVQTSTQVERIVTGCKQSPMLTGCTVVNASATVSPPYHGSDEGLNALSEAERLLAVGTSNERRLLARVTSARLVEIYEEPASSEVTLYIGPDGKLYETAGGSQRIPMRAERCPCAVWAKLIDTVPATLDTSALGEVGPLFIESAEYDCESGEWMPETRDVTSPWDLVRAL